MKNKVKIHEQICSELTELYRKKNADYGDSFSKTFEEEGYAMARIRLSDKLERFKSLSRKFDSDPYGHPEVSDESMMDTLMDLANYAIMTLIEMKGEEESLAEFHEAMKKLDAGKDTVDELTKKIVKQSEDIAKSQAEAAKLAPPIIVNTPSAYSTSNCCCCDSSLVERGHQQQEHKNPVDDYKKTDQLNKLNGGRYA